VDNADLRLRAGLFAEAEVVVDPDAMAVVIPETALAEFAGARKVWKVIDGVAQEQSVLIGDRREGLVRITEGISPGDFVLEDASQGMVARIQSSGK
jgi:membrane fusion protein (multidrug efflux system)